MSGENNDPRSVLLNQVIADYLAAVESGNAPDRDELIRQHPNLADDLRSFLADHDRMKAAKEGIEAPTLPPSQMALEAATIPPGEPTSPGAEDMTLPPGPAGLDDVERPRTQVGDKVRYFGDYELLEEIARGGMGVVYKARQINLNRTVALKMILAGQLAGEDDVKRFYTEAEAAANLDHPGIVPIFEVGEHEGQHYFSMGFIEGESLADRLKDGPLPPREAAEYTMKVAEAIAFAHEHGVIHRDLKPANVLLQAEGRRPKTEDSRASQHSSSPDLQSTAYSLQPKVTDFGLAKKTEGDSNLTGTGQILGTPSYMPPEQASGKVDEVTELADVYSLGAILYALLTARPPFQADNPLDTLMQVLEREPIAPRILNPKVPRDLETIGLKCLEKDRHRRYATAQDLAAELQRFLDGKPILARPISAPARAWRWCKRKPVVAVLIATVVASVLSGLISTTHFAISAKRRAEAAEWQLHLARINSSLREWELGESRSAKEILESCPASHRGWEYYYLASRFRRGVKPLPGVFGNPEGGDSLLNGVRSLAATPDWARVVISYGDGAQGQFGVFDINDGALVHRLGRPQGTVYQTLYSPDGAQVFALSRYRSGQIDAWDAITGEHRLTIGDLIGANCFAVSPNGAQIAAQKARTIRVWDSHTGDVIGDLPAHNIELSCLAFSADGENLVIGDFQSGRAEIWEVKSAELKLTLLPPTSASEPQGICCIAVSPDGKRIVAGLSNSHLRMWDSESAELLFDAKGHNESVNTVAFSSDSQRIASGSRDSTICLWNASTGAKLFTLHGHSGPVNSIAFHRDGRRMISGGQGNTADSVLVWDAERGQAPFSIETHARRIESLRFTENCSQLLSSSQNDSICLTDLQTGKVSNAFSELDGIRGAAFSPQGDRAALLLRDCIRVVDTSTGKALSVISKGRGNAYVQFSGNSQTIFATCREAHGSNWSIRCFDAKSGDERWAVDSGIAARTFLNYIRFAIRSDGRQLAAIYPREIKLFDAMTGKELGSVGQGSKYSRVGFHPDNRRLAASSGNTVLIWQPNSPEPTLEVEGNVFAFSPDGSRLATGDSTQVKLWDLTTGDSILTIKDHSESISCLAFSPNGNHLASGSSRGKIIIWDGVPDAGRS